MAFSDIIGVLSLKRDVIKRLSETEGAGKEGSLIVFLTGLIASVLGGLIAGNIGNSIVAGLFGGLFMILLVGIGAGILHLVSLLFKGKGSAIKIFKPLSHAYPLAILSVIPFVNLLVAIYMFVVDVVIVSEVEKISVGAAVAVVIIPTIIIVVLMVIAFAAFLGALLGAAGLAGAL